MFLIQVRLISVQRGRAVVQHVGVEQGPRRGLAAMVQAGCCCAQPAAHLPAVCLQRGVIVFFYQVWLISVQRGGALIQHIWGLAGAKEGVEWQEFRQGGVVQRQLLT